MTSNRLKAAIAAGGGLVNAGDLSRRWNISRARVSELVNMPSFPEPIAHVGGRPAWLAAECDTWRKNR